MLSWQHLCISLSKNGVILLDFYSYLSLVIYARLWLICVCTVRSEEGLVAGFQRAVPCCPDEYPWARQGLLLMGSLTSTALAGVSVQSPCRLAEGCGSVMNWKALQSQRVCRKLKA